MLLHKEKTMLAQHKGKIISALAVAFLAAFAAFYDSVVGFVTESFVNYADEAVVEGTVDPQITDAVTSEEPAAAETEEAAD